MSEHTRVDVRSQVFFMLISAGLFAWFGFGFSWAHQYTVPPDPQLVPMVVVLKWTLRVGAIVFALAAAISMTGAVAGPALYAVSGVVTAVLFLLVAGWDLVSPLYSGIHPILLAVFAVWNGYGSWSGLQALLAGRRAAARSDDPRLP